MTPAPSVIDCQHHAGMAGAGRRCRGRPGRRIAPSLQALLRPRCPRCGCLCIRPLGPLMALNEHAGRRRSRRITSAAKGRGTRRMVTGSLNPFGLGWLAGIAHDLDRQRERTISGAERFRERRISRFAGMRQPRLLRRGPRRQFRDRLTLRIVVLQPPIGGCEGCWRPMPWAVPAGVLP